MTTFHAISGTNAAGDALIEISGELDLASAEEFLSAVGDAAETATALLFDLGGVTFMDSTGLGALIKVRNQVIDRGGELRLTATSAAVERVLDLTGMSEVFGVA